MDNETYADVAPGIGVIGALSFSNGNCVVVVMLSDGTYLVYDSKLMQRSPVWHLSAAQFHKLGRHLTQSMGMIHLGVIMVDLGEGANFTMKRVAPGQFNWSLSTHPESFTFELAEIAAFCLGYHRGQFPVGAPLRELVSFGPPSWHPSR